MEEMRWKVIAENSERVNECAVEWLTKKLALWKWDMMANP